MGRGMAVAVAVGVLAGVATGAQAAIPAAERAALVALYESTGGDAWLERDGWLGEAGSECSWHGVLCDPGRTHVLALNLVSNNLVGTLPEEIGDLGRLQTLALGRELGGATGNQLQGEIPAGLWRLANLQILNLVGTGIGGTIPPEVAGLSRLQLLYLQGNRLRGTLPVELGSLAQLRHLVVGVNQLEGTIPAELGQLAALEYLYLWQNQLSGSIPPELGALGQLQRLVLDDNLLSGTIPAELAQAARLDTLSLRSNRLEGAVPAALGDLRSLQWLRLDQNRLVGTVPAELAAIPNLLSLTLGGNQLSGTIPPELGRLELLQGLDLGSNRLTGTIPAELAGSGALRVLLLGDNSLSGRVPAELGGLRNLLGLDLRSNMLAGDLPASLGQLETLSDGGGLDLRWNALSTDDPELAAFLAGKQVEGDWQSTQTVPPSGLAPTEVGRDGFALSWRPIDYTWDGGHYGVGVATAAGGPYEVLATTADKAAAGASVTGLAPGTTYHVVVRAVTEPHPSNRNRVESRPTAELAVTTVAADACTLSCEASAPAESEVDAPAAFVGRVEAAGACSGDVTFAWDFGDGSAGSGGSAEHAYRWPGSYAWTLTARQGEVSCSTGAPIVVFAAGSECGNSACEGGETAWTCAADCGLAPEQTGRCGGPAASSAVPAAVGGQGGVGGTYWVSEAMLFNPGPSPATVELSFTADDAPGEVVAAAPRTLASGAAVLFPNFVQDLFATTANGCVRLAADQPVMLVSRTFNDQPQGTYGQHLGAVPAHRALGTGDLAYLIGLREDGAFRSNLIVQEVAGAATVVRVTVRDGDGAVRGEVDLDVPALTKVQRRLLNLGFGDLTDGYATLQVRSGGQVVAAASVVDEATGDAVTQDALHPRQAEVAAEGGRAKRLRPVAVALAQDTTVDFDWSPWSPAPGDPVQFTDLSTGAILAWSWSFGDGERSSEQNPSHVYQAAGTYGVTLAVSSSAFGSSFLSQTVTVSEPPEEEGAELLVAVVARAAGAAGTEWRSDLWLMNPLDAAQQAWLTYRPSGSADAFRSQLAVGAGQLVAVEDVVGTLFGDSGDGKGGLEVWAPDGLFVSSRTYNLGPDGTYGQAIAALGGGDLLAAGGPAGRLLKVKQTETIRCNVGFTEHDGLATTVELRLWAADPTGPVELAAATFDLEPHENLQVNQVFSALGLDGDHEAALASVRVLSGGRVYAYASNVDNRTGDGELIPAMVE